MKTYKTWEVIKMLEENKENKYINQEGMVISLLNVYGSYFINVINRLGCEIDFSKNVRIGDTWTIAPKLATWEEVLKSNKRVRVEHDLTKNHDIFGEYYYLDDLFSYLSIHFNSSKIGKILSEAKFYLEEE